MEIISSQENTKNTPTPRKCVNNSPFGEGILKEFLNFSENIRGFIPQK